MSRKRISSLKYFFNRFKISIKKIFILLLLIIILVFSKKPNIKVALCTMGKQENLYVKEFINYYNKLGIDNIFIYDDNDINSEKISDMIDFEYRSFVKIYETKKIKLFKQYQVYTDCYEKNMVDMDEYLYIKKDKLKNYLLKPVFKKCDFIKFHWVHPTDNDNLYYENKSLFERFKGPYKNSIFVKSIVRGGIPKLKYWVHSPFISPEKNSTCNNIGNKINNNIINIEYINNINIKKAFIIHFNYKSTEEFIKKYKRGYSNWFGKRLPIFLKYKIDNYFKDNKITKEKVEYFEKELNINLSDLKKTFK